MEKNILGNSGEINLHGFPPGMQNGEIITIIRGDFRIR